jgi:hypothetical protein
MRLGLWSLAIAWFCGGAFFAAAQTQKTAEIPAGTILEIRLEQPIYSHSTEDGTKIRCLLIAPVKKDGKIVLPIGASLEGTVVSIHGVGLGVKHETAEIDFTLDRLLLSDGTELPIKGRITQVENAREKVDPDGTIRGIRATSTLSHRTSGMLGTLAFGDPIAAIFTTAGSASVLRFSEPEIAFPEGTEMLAQLKSPLEVPVSDADPVSPVAASSQERGALDGLVRGLPFRTVTEGSKIPSDLTNLLFIGSAGALERAFAASGWEPTDDLTAQSTYSTVRSIAENQGYRRAPMSTLLLGGQKPKYAYAKTLNTFSKRHHLRIWLTAEKWQGQPVWTSSSTHDIGIGFSKENKTFIHLIDTHIDNERAKVVNDLFLTGCVTGVQLVARPWVPRDAKNGTGEALITDGRIAAIQLNDCEHPKTDFAEDGVETQKVYGNRAERTTRQVVLTLRNNLLRDNLGVMAYSGIRSLTAAKNKKPHEAPVRQMEVGGQTYTVQSEFKPQDAYVPVSDSNIQAGSGNSVGPANRWMPPSVELNIHTGWAGYAGGNGGAMVYIFEPTNAPGSPLVLVLGNVFKPGWTIGGTVTLNSQKYFSHEFSYDHSFTTFRLGLVAVDGDETSPAFEPLFAFSDTPLQTSQFAYNLLINARPKTSRWRPYVAVGPSFELMHLSDAPIKKAPGYFKLGLSSIGLIAAAYDFGGTPPLEGGGIFEFGLNYGGGIKYRITPRWMVRADYRETLIPQPDFWTKSKKDILAGIYVDDYSVQEQGPFLNGPMRQLHATAGVSFTF